MQLVAFFALLHIVLIVLIVVDGGKKRFGSVVVDAVDVVGFAALPVQRSHVEQRFIALGFGAAQVGIPSEVDSELAIFFRIIA